MKIESLRHTGKNFVFLERNGINDDYQIKYFVLKNRTLIMVSNTSLISDVREQLCGTRAIY
jgi:hypothetical protein